MKHYKVVQCEKQPPGAVRPFQWCYRGLIEDPERFLQTIEELKRRGGDRNLIGVRIYNRHTKEIVLEKMFEEI